MQFASKGATVTGYDISAARVDEINAKHNPLPSEPGLSEKIPGLVVDGHLRATTDPRDAVANADVVVLIVPVDIDDAHRPDFTMLDAALDAISPHLKRGVLVIVETTVPVGTTRHRVGPKIAAATGFALSADFSLAFSPERVSSGQVLRDLRTYPKIVGGIDAHSTARAVEFYAAMLDAEIMPVRDAETAEFSKLAETTYRDVNIALANEFARIADSVGVDALEAIAAANSQPYSHVHAPGPGVGGHCIPVYPYFLAAPETPDAAAFDAAVETALITTAREINDGMAQYAVARLSDAHRLAARNNRRHPRPRLPRRSERVAPQQRLRPRRRAHRRRRHHLRPRPALHGRRDPPPRPHAATLMADPVHRPRRASLAPPIRRSRPRHGRLRATP